MPKHETVIALTPGFLDKTTAEEVDDHVQNIPIALAIITATQTVENWIQYDIGEDKLDGYVEGYITHKGICPQHYVHNLQREGNILYSSVFSRQIHILEKSKHHCRDPSGLHG